MNKNDLKCHETFDYSSLHKKRSQPMTTWRLKDLDKIVENQYEFIKSKFRKAKNPSHEDWYEDELLKICELKEWMEEMKEKKEKVKKPIFKIVKINII